MVSPSFPGVSDVWPSSLKFHKNCGPEVSTSDDVISIDVIGPNLAQLLTLKPHFARRQVNVARCTSISSLQPLVVSDMNICPRGIISMSSGNKGVAECSATCWKIKIN